MGCHSISVVLLSLRPLRLSGESLESARNIILRQLNENCARDGFNILLNFGTLEIIRSNKVLNYAGADRIQTGMRNPFGKVCGRVGRVDNYKEIFTLVGSCSEKATLILACYAVKSKLAARTKVVVSRRWG